jgi:hypothetical protein
VVEYVAFVGLAPGFWLVALNKRKQQRCNLHTNSFRDFEPLISSSRGGDVGHDDFDQGDQMRLLKCPPKCSPNHFLSKLLHNFYGGTK